MLSESVLKCGNIDLTSGGLNTGAGDAGGRAVRWQNVCEVWCGIHVQ